MRGNTAYRWRIVGLNLLAAFFAFGAIMCALTLVLLLFPGSLLEPLWRLNPEAQVGFRTIGHWALVLMLVTGIACALASAGLLRRAEWGRRLAIAILSVNLLGDLGNAVIRHDYRTLIGLPIAAALIAYLMSASVREIFGQDLTGNSTGR